MNETFHDWDINLLFFFQEHTSEVEPEANSGFAKYLNDSNNLMESWYHGRF